MKGYNTSNGYMGYVEGKYILFASEQEYSEFTEDQGGKIERTSLSVICGEMVAKLATISDCIFEDKRWTEPKKYGKISIRNEALKSGDDGE